MDENTPSLNGPNGRDAGGRFAKGNSGGPGNPYARRVNELRSALMDAVSKEDVAGIAQALLKKAKGGDVQSAKLLFERLLGPAEALDLLNQVEELREKVETMMKVKGI